MTNKKIKIPFSQEDLEELMNGETFDWTFDGVDVHLFMGYDDEDGTVCTKCGNPNEMYWCSGCEENVDSSMCEKGHGCNLDEDYHDYCN